MSREKIFDHIKRDELSDAIREILAFAKLSDYPSYRRAVLLSREFHNLKNAVIEGRLNWHQEVESKNRITRRLIMLLDEI